MGHESKRRACAPGRRLGAAAPTRPSHRRAPATPRGEFLCLLAALSTSCTREEFPKSFLFGAAVAGFQIEMGCPSIPAEECEDARSDWYQFVTSTVTVARESNHLRGDPPSFGPGYYELFEADLDRLAALGLRAFRFSVEWSRVFPDSTIGVEGDDALRARASPRALDYYHRQLDAMRARGITPLVTLHHYTLPSWIHDAVGCNRDLARCRPRGWLEPSIVGEIAKYAGFVARELGSDVDLWATENEPLAVVLPGYIFPTESRTNPPAATLRTEEAKTALLHMIEAHARMYDAIKSFDLVDADGDGRSSRVGIVYNVAPVHPRDPSSPLDRWAAENVSYLYNRVFLDAIVKGRLDADLDRSSEPRDDLLGRSDYIGLNYYTRAVVEGQRESILPDFSPLATFNPLTLEQGPPYSKGIYEAALGLTREYGLPLFITENGGDSASQGDTTPFLVEHLQWVRRAIDEGALVEGYFWWSLMDNYEWNNGMSFRFGLYEVDPADPEKTRRPRPVAEAYRRIAEARRVPDELAREYPIPQSPAGADAIPPL